MRLFPLPGGTGIFDMTLFGIESLSESDEELELEPEDDDADEELDELDTRARFVGGGWVGR